MIGSRAHQQERQDSIADGGGGRAGEPGAGTGDAGGEMIG